MITKIVKRSTQHAGRRDQLPLPFLASPSGPDFIGSWSENNGAPHRGRKGVVAAAFGERVPGGARRYGSVAGGGDAVAALAAGAGSGTAFAWCGRSRWSSSPDRAEEVTAP